MNCLLIVEHLVEGAILAKVQTMEA